jgi:hypothetical protein
MAIAATPRESMKKKQTLKEVLQFSLFCFLSALVHYINVDSQAVEIEQVSS